MNTKPKRPVLVYRSGASGDGLVLAKKSRAAYVARIHHALNTAKTWGAFKRMMPAREYARVVRELDEGNPGRRDAFDAMSVPGFADGDYPPWLQQEMRQVIPVEVLQEFGKDTMTMLNGNYWHIDPAHLPALKDRLEALGYDVRDGSSLGSWH